MIRTPRPFNDDERGVSVVIGAILVLGLLVATTITIRVNYEPIWERDREAAHMRLVEGQLATLKAEIDRQVDNRTTVAVASPLSLGVTRSGFLGSTKDEGILSFTPGNRPFQVSSTRFLVQEEGSTSYLGLQETWTAISGTINVETIGTVHSLRLRLASAVQNHAGDAVTITATDSASAFAGDLRVLISTSGATNWVATVRVRDAASTVLAEVSASFPNDQTQTPYWIDALRPDYRFDRVLAAASKPLRLTFGVANVNGGGANQDLSADYAITYSQSGSQVVQGGGGLLRLGYSKTFTGGLLQYTARNNQFPEQDYLLEHGAILLSQADGASIRVDPPFSASLAGSTTGLVLSIPTLVGTSSTNQGAQTTTIYSSSVAPTTISGQAPQFTLTVTTSKPSLWTTLWTNELEPLPGYAAGTQFTTSTTATTATLNVIGLNSDATTNDLYVQLHQSGITLDIRS